MGGVPRRLAYRKPPAVNQRSDQKSYSQRSNPALATLTRLQWHNVLMPDTAAILEEILLEADALIRQRQRDRGFEFPHLVVAVATDGKVLLRSNVSPDGLRSFSEDLENVANELETPLGAGEVATEQRAGDAQGERRPLTEVVKQVQALKTACHRLLRNLDDDLSRALLLEALAAYKAIPLASLPASVYGLVTTSRDQVNALCLRVLEANARAGRSIEHELQEVFKTLGALAVALDDAAS